MISVLRRPWSRHKQRGTNLIELIISIVIISLAVGGVLLVFSTTVGRSADPAVQQQALAIGEAYLDEILARPAADPDGTNAGETRATFDNVADYNGLNEAPTNQNGAALAGLGVYTVAVAVTATIIGPAGDTAPMLQVDVTVSLAPDVNLTLTGYRGVY